MRTSRESLISALAGFQVGVLFTLGIVEYQSGERIIRLALLVLLTCLAVATLWGYVRLVREPEAGVGWQGTPKEGQKPNTISPSKEGTIESSRGSANSDKAGDPGLGRVPAGSGANWNGPQRSGAPPSPPAVLHQAEAATEWNLKPVSSYSAEAQFHEDPLPQRHGGAVPSGRLIEVWNDYFSNGSGTFTADGLKSRLESAGIVAEVTAGEQLGTGDKLVGVDLRDGSGLLHLLPNFNRPMVAVEDWFRPASSGSRKARIQKLIRPATAVRKGGGLVLKTKGEVE